MIIHKIIYKSGDNYKADGECTACKFRGVVLRFWDSDRIKCPQCGAQKKEILDYVRDQSGN